MLLKIVAAPDLSPGFQREVELRKIIFLTICFILLAGCAVNRYHSDFEFANKLAKEGLWKEAYYRWQKALTVKGDTAALHNNQAVALESIDRKPEAEQAYLLAMKLDPGNVYIKSNYDRFQKNQGKETGKEKNEK